MRGMSNIQAFLDTVNRYCSDAGITPESLFGRATGNRRLYDRFLRRAEVLEGDVARITRHMEENPNKGGAQ